MKDPQHPCPPLYPLGKPHITTCSIPTQVELKVAIEQQHIVIMAGHFTFFSQVDFSAA